jgi:glycerol uptake facilitator-like aquaporin
MIVSLALFGASSIAGNISGACLNPAIGFAHNFVRLIVTGDVNECKFLWIYVLGPTLGGIAAALLYKGFFMKFFQHKNRVAQSI